MKRILAFVLLCGAYCMGQTPTPGIIQNATAYGGSTMAAGTNYFIGGNFGSLVAMNANPLVYQSPTTATLQNLYVNTSSTIAGNTVTATVYLNGNPTAITCAITTGQPATCTDFTHSAAVNQGDAVMFVFACTGTCSGTSIGAIFAEVGTGTTGYMQWQTTNASPSMTAGAQYAIQPSLVAPFSTSGNIGGVMSQGALQAGHLQNMIVNTGGPVPAGDSIVVSVFVNAVLSPMTCTLASASQGCTDFTDSVAVNQGDKIQIALVCTGPCGALTGMGGITAQIGAITP
jgi:hypothetical protein